MPIDINSIDPADIWANYDAELDTLLLYLTGSPVPGVTTFLDGGLAVITDLDTDEVVGFRIEAWERSFVPSDPKLAARWPSVRRSLAPGDGWSNALRLLTWVVLFWSLLMVDEEDNLALVAALV